MIAWYEWKLTASRRPGFLHSSGIRHYLYNIVRDPQKAYGISLIIPHHSSFTFSRIMVSARAVGDVIAMSMP